MTIELFIGAILGLGIILIANGIIESGRANLSARLYPASNSQDFELAKLLSHLFEPIRSAFGGERVSKRRMQAALFELPEILELMAVALTAGDGMFVAFARVVPRAKGVLAQELKAVLISLELGGNLQDELRALARKIPQRQVVEFANKLVLSLRRGSPLALLLREQAASARAEVRNELLRQAGKNETRMLIPLIFLILPVTILFAIYPSLQLLNLNYL